MRRDAFTKSRHCTDDFKDGKGPGEPAIQFVRDIAQKKTSQARKLKGSGG